MEQALPVEVRSATVIEDDRRALFLELTRNGADPAEAKRLDGHLAGSVEQHYSAVEVARLIGRSTDYVGQQLRAGKFGTASGVKAWLAGRTYGRTVKEDG